MSDSTLESLEIQLADGPSPIYKGGEVIKGKIHVRLRKPITVFAVRLQIKGRAAWLEDKDKQADVEKVFFDQDMALLERPPGKPDPHHFTWIENFDYQLPFEMPLPKGCPTSFEGPHAFIRYFIKASLVEEDGKDLREYFVKNAFSIVSPSDGNVVRGEPQNTAQTVGFGSCCCKGKVTAELDLPQTGYLPGDKVYGTLKLNNKKPKELLSQMEVRFVDRVRRVGAPEKSASPYRTLYYRKLEQQTIPKGYKTFEKDDLFLFTVPPVPPSTKGDFDNITEEMARLSPTRGLMESQSSATLRFRRTPFLIVEYAIQVSIGNNILLEVPVEIGELKTTDEATVLKPFVAGPQSIEEPEDQGKVAFNGPFTYTPMYPYVESAVPNGVPEETKKSTPIVKISEPSDDHHSSSEREPLLKQQELEHVVHTTTTTFVSKTGDEPAVVTTSTTQFTQKTGEEPTIIVSEVTEEVPEHPAAQESHPEPAHSEEPSVVEEPTPVARRSTSRESSEPVQERISEPTVAATQESPVEESTDTSAAEQYFVTEPRVSEPLEEEEMPATVDASATVSNGDNEEGVTTVSTETFVEDGITTVRTTTVTRYPDGSESTHVREEKTSEPIVISSKDGEIIQSGTPFQLPEAQEGDVTETHTETFSENGVTTVRTTYVTKHADGSESRRVHEESHQEVIEEISE